MQRILQVLDEEKLATKAPDILGSIGRALCAKKRLALVIAKNAEVQKNALSIADPAEFLDALFVADVHAEVDRQYRVRASYPLQQHIMAIHVEPTTGGDDRITCELCARSAAAGRLLLPDPLKVPRELGGHRLQAPLGQRRRVE